MSNRMIFCVWCPPYLDWSGGSIALHRLVHMIAETGHECHAVGCHKNDKWLGGLIAEDKIEAFLQQNADRAVMIYPEVVHGNPYKAKNVVRWLLNDPKVTTGKIGLYPESELLFTFCEYYSSDYKDRILGELGTFDLRIDSYEDKGRHIKGKTCYTIRKGYNKVHDKHPADAICIRDYQEQQVGEDLIKIFDDCETFISYDHNCFLSVHAALRGCLSIVIPDPAVSKEDWKAKNAYMHYGIAYGFDDIEWAKSTQHRIKDLLRKHEVKSNAQVHHLILVCYLRFNTQ